MPSTRSGASYSPFSSSQKGYRGHHDRIQPVTEGKGSVNGSKTDKLCHSEADNTVKPSNRADISTISLSGPIKRQSEGLQQCITAQRVPDPCISVEKLHELLPECEKTPVPSQHLQVTQWITSIDGKAKHDAFNSRIVEKHPSTTQASAKNSPSSQKKKFKCKKEATSSEQGKRQGTSHKPYIQGYRIPNIQPDSMENVFQMGRTMM
ncbi:hypothetical protein O181_103333 [Austropuccinia psidii MF-1]|uniref:Uncharacterized protein n=1 Tax=Austropuccinia psidii MF-1 TaxID=1389203 RepID=A0A9Q3JI30_9BASI|nr:hypothetical protein [Austropuccinia psidii MF-1]